LFFEQLALEKPQKSYITVNCTLFAQGSIKPLLLHQPVCHKHNVLHCYTHIFQLYEPVLLLPGHLVENQQLEINLSSYDAFNDKRNAMSFVSNAYGLITGCSERLMNKMQTHMMEN